MTTADYPSRLFSREFLTGKYTPERHRDFTRVSAKYTTRKNIYLIREAYSAFQKMHAAALKDGIRLNILSATRNFQHQKWLWLDKWTGRSRVDGINLVKKFPKPMDRAREILRYSSMPGTSRHHWGTDMDLNNLYDDYFTQGKGKKVFNWLIKNAPSYGFCMPYSALGKSRTYGYEEEKWHWSFQPLSSQLLAAYLKKISVKDIRGFKGDLVVEKLNVIQIYVQSVDPLCR